MAASVRPNDERNCGRAHEEGVYLAAVRSSSRVGEPNMDKRNLMTPEDIRTYADEMRGRAQLLGARAADGTHARGDARNSFHNSVSNAILNHCITLGMFHATGVFPLAQRRDAVVVDVIQLFHIAELQQSYLAKQRSHLFLETWFAFEDQLRVLYGAVVPRKTREADLASEKARFVHPPKRLTLNVPTTFSRVLDAAAIGQPRPRKQLKHHRDVVDFFSATRNAMCHANTFYTGPPRSLKLGRRTLKLVDGAPTDFHSFAVMPLLVDELAGVADFLRTGLDSHRFPRVDSPSWLFQKAALRDAVPQT